MDNSKPTSTLRSSWNSALTGVLIIITYLIALQFGRSYFAHDHPLGVVYIERLMSFQIRLHGYMIVASLIGLILAVVQLKTPSERIPTIIGMAMHSLLIIYFLFGIFVPAILPLF